MKKYILKRIGMSVATLLVIVLVLFILMQLLPGSPFNDERLSIEQQQVLMSKYGLDDSVPVQFFRYVKNMLTGDFGKSYTISKNTDVSLLLQNRLPTSLLLGGLSILLGSVAGLLLGVAAALKHNSLLDSMATFFSVIGVSIPSYVFALGLSYLFGFQLSWLPMLYNADDGLRAFALPAVALSMTVMATVARFTRTEMIEVLNSDYMQLVESKGVSGIQLIFKHALRNASISIITILGPLVVSLMTGSLVVEKIFSIPGIGQLMVQAIQSNDYNVILALAFVYSALYIFVMLAVDILYGVLDPRIRLAKEGANG
ncbi:MAG: ABC transporter permease [Alkalibacterium sp.]|uniref:Oligopeptide transport system permease protein n=1 Tax=Alkalibacterium gilvum TaxID=1130080 RepID=A0A1H6RSC4_9LACT|nr:MULTISPECIES: ABC transporter permease [Alkalibacterium]MDN6193739.1 ABC transporter permease [Alkalibacterium sp.]MDN6294246.1 ABC transporter permease [Alkalibacterium sp.]MDN6295942.1 ABC transporter permease [Alkalibacterium sp.]MDN6326457.1 ABC transporter permease [Alkalibacterium sp.]MDN6385271.1 ABC transporter permease [Alkalibacterium sp.]